METITNIENQNLIPNIPQLPQKNNYKTLFFIFLGLFLVILIILIYFLTKTNKPNQVTKNMVPSPTLIPTQTVKEEKVNLLKISDIQMDLPEGWTVSSISQNRAEILTDYKKYKVYLTLEVTENADNLYESRNNVIKTQYGEVFGFQFGGPYAGTGALINNKKYYFVWNINGNQPTPANLDGIWIPDNNITPEIIMNITKTARPLTETLNPIQDWKTYTDSTYKYSIQYPLDWILRNKSTNIITLATQERDNLAKESNYTGSPNMRIEVFSSISELPDNSEKLILIDWIKKYTDIKDFKQLTINGIAAYSFYDGYPVYNIYLQKGNFIYHINDYSLPQGKIEQQIINSFKFN